MTKKLQGKIALVTGAGRGIGRQIALKLASEGANLVINDLDEGPAAATVEEIKKLGVAAISCHGNITHTDFPDRFIKTAVDEFGGIDILVNNAGYSWDTVIQKMTDQQFQAMLDVHVTAPVRILRSASAFIIPTAKQEKAEGRVVARKVVNISSISGLYGNAGQIGYSTGKAAIIGVTKTMAKEWGRYNVNVNCVAFGLIQTRMTAPIGSPESIAQIGDNTVKMGVPPEFVESNIKLIPLGRAGTPEDAAGAVYLFCIPESGYITGQVLLVSGGQVI